MIINKENYKLYQGDCLKIMDKLIEEGIKVDCILTDPPYGTTNCKWDSVIPFDAMWERINKLIKPNGAICLFGSEPFSSYLRMSNIKNYKYDWKWVKQRGTGHLNAKRQPMRNTEDIIVFYKKQPTYNPIMLKGKPYTDKREGQQINKTLYNGCVKKPYINKTTRYPVNTLYFDKVFNNQLHNCQKPVPLLEYLIKTYTNENETVLDFTMGTCSTGVACMNTNRKFIGIELDKNYFEIGKKRMGDLHTQYQV